MSDSVRAKCPECGTRIKVKAAAMKQEVTCPSCKERVTLLPAPKGVTPPMESLELLESAESGGFAVDIFQYKTLGGSRDVRVSELLFFANQSGLRLKQVRIRLKNSEAVLESGALHFLKGTIEINAKAGGSGGIMGLAKGIAAKALTKETVFRPRYKGTGELWLEPSFGHFLIHNLNRKGIIVDKGLFYASEGRADVTVAMQKNISSALFGGEGLFQTAVKGDGIVILESPVPSNEVIKYELNKETLQVDGNFALLRTEGIEFSVGKSSKSWLGSAFSGEGILQTFKGTGTVWLAPTEAIYDMITHSGIDKVVEAGHSSHSETDE